MRERERERETRAGSDGYTDTHSHFEGEVSRQKAMEAEKGKGLMMTPL